MAKHRSKIDPGKRLHILVAGCGGTGSQVLGKIARLIHAMKGLGSRREILIHAFDGDHVTEANAGRQMFYTADIGRNKAEVLIERINLCFGQENIFEAEPLLAGSIRGDFSLFGEQVVLVSCTDTRASRREIADARRAFDKVLYHIDCGNDKDYGQVVIGDGSAEMPWPEDAFPALVAPGPEDSTPSCSLAEALEKQNLYVNDMAALICGELLRSLIRDNGLETRGAFFRLNDLAMQPIKLKTKQKEG